MKRLSLLLLVSAIFLTAIGCGEGTVKEQVIREQAPLKGQKQGGGMTATHGIND